MDFFFIINYGRVALVKTSDSRLVVLKVCEGKEMVGEDCAFGGSSKYGYSAICLEDCEVVEINVAPAKESLGLQKDWVRSILKICLQRWKTPSG